MMNLTLRGIDAELESRLRALAARESRSLNATIIEILRLDDLAGGWSEADLAEFAERTRPFEQIDADLWQ
jgi:plasmid stability protein